jgi:hypothetical protein
MINRTMSRFGRENGISIYLADARRNLKDSAECSFHVVASLVHHIGDYGTTTIRVRAGNTIRLEWEREVPRGASPTDMPQRRRCEGPLSQRLVFWGA